jgi:hypothetical protein
MRKYLITIQIFYLFIGLGFSQNCLPDGILFSTQQEIDSFNVHFPDCKIIEGSVQIDGTGITNLIGLNGLTEIQGSLLIGGYIGIDITDLTGLESLESIGGRLNISNCYWLQNINSLQNLNHIGDDLELYQLWSLDDLIGLEGLTEIAGSLTVNDCYLYNFSGLDNLQSIGGSLYLDNLRYINDLNSLTNLQSISGSLSIIYTSLSDIYALERIPPESISNLKLDSNNNLTDCQLQNICTYLSNPNGEVMIQNNATGCNSEEEVGYECLVGFTESDESGKEIGISLQWNSEILSIHTNKIEIEKVEIYNQIGELVISDLSSSKQIHISSLINGVYIVRISSVSSSIAKVFIKQ